VAVRVIGNEPAAPSTCDGKVRWWMPAYTPSFLVQSPSKPSGIGSCGKPSSMARDAHDR
jgi:hypothetical protein